MLTEKFRKSEWRVAEVPLSVAQSMVRQYHYSGGGSNTAVYTHGLFRKLDDECCGVVWWLPPTRVACESVNKAQWKKVLSLTRMVVVPGVPKNACSFLLSKSVKLIERDGRFVSLVTYADESQDHNGLVYRAANWPYVGRTGPYPRWLNSSGRQVTPKSTVNRTKKQMEELGHTKVGSYYKHKYVLHFKQKGEIMTQQPAHAKLSASGSEKWMTCTPSARMEESFPDEGSEFAREGTFAHAVFEQEMLNYLGRKTEPLPPELMHFDSPALREYVRESVDYAIKRIEEARERCKDPVFYVERKLDFSRWVTEGFGTGDLVIITDDLVEVMDLKYGKGIYVDAKDNSQMRLYGLGAFNELSDLYDIKRVRMTVLQPRLANYSSEELTIDELLRWADEAVVPAAKLAWAGEGVFVPGPHCSSSFCKARFTCPARAEGALAVARQEFSSLPPAVDTLTMDRISELLPSADAVIKWFSDLQEHALKQAEKGTTVPGYKLVEGRSVRKYSDQDAVSAKLIEAGIPEAVIYERSLLGITAMTDSLGKKKFVELLGDLVIKPQGKPTLVPEGDKRPAITSRASALDDFSKPV